MLRVTNCTNFISLLVHNSLARTLLCLLDYQEIHNEDYSLTYPPPPRYWNTIFHKHTQNWYFKPYSNKNCKRYQASYFRFKKDLIPIITPLLLLSKKYASQFRRKPANENKSEKNESYLIRQNFQGYRCTSGIVILAMEGDLKLRLESI